METAEFNWLEEIKLIPDDNARRLIYADWLAERGDVRAEFLRIEVELESRPREKNSRSLIELLTQLSKQIKQPQWESAIVKGRLSELILSLHRNSPKTRKTKGRKNRRSLRS